MPEAGVGIGLCHRIKHAFRIRIIYIPVTDTTVYATVLLHIRPCSRVNLLYLYTDTGCLRLLLECSSDRYIALILRIYGYTKIDAIRITGLCQKFLRLFRIVLELRKTVIVANDARRDVRCRNGSCTMQNTVTDRLTIDAECNRFSDLCIRKGLRV